MQCHPEHWLVMADSDVRDAQQQHSKPEHPLPEAIQKMDRDETVCKYCGVSYLIHNEIKALEAKLKECESQLSHLRGREDREAALQQRLSEAKQSQDASEKRIEDADKIIYTLRAELAENKTQAQRQSEVLKDKVALQEKDQKALDNLRQKVSVYEKTLPEIRDHLTQQRGLLLSLKKSVSSNRQHMDTDCENIAASVSKTVNRLKEGKADVESMEKRNSELENEAQKLQQQLEGAKESAKVQKNRLSTRVTELEEQHEDSSQQKRKLTLEIEHYKEQIKKHMAELEQARNQSRQAEMAADEMITQLYKEAKTKENTLQAARAQVVHLEQELDQGRRMKEQSQKQVTVSQSRTEAIQSELSRVRGDVEALKSEREMMITAHQNQIEQLRESFRKRTAEIDMWPKKLEKSTSEAKRQHMLEMDALRKQLNDSHNMEMQIERQKNDELVEKYTIEMRTASAKLKASLDGEHQRELAQLHAQIAEIKARGCDSESMLRSEITSLKNIINDLESRIGKLTTGSSENVDRLVNELSTARSELSTLKEDLEHMVTQHKDATEQVAFVQETVRRECEERFELTQALSEAKEELLRLKKPLGGYGNSQAVSSSRKSTTWQKDEKDTNRSTATSNYVSRSGLVASVTLPSGGERQKQTATASSAKSHSSGGSSSSPHHKEEMVLYKKARNHSQLANRVAPATKAAHGGGASIVDSRKRIAQALAKRTNDGHAR